MNLPGSTVHQGILRLLVESFQEDPNILMFGVFGSLGRGDWDGYSDLDLDVIMAEADKRRVDELVQRVSAGLNRSPFALLLVFEERAGSWVFITRGLERLSMRFHTLAETSPHILDSLLVLTGTLTTDDLPRVTGVPSQPIASLRLRHYKFLEQSVYVPIYLHRNQLLAALRVMQTLRDLIINIWSEAHDIPKAEKFESTADTSLIAAILSSYSSPDRAEIRRAWWLLVQLYRSRIGDWTGGRIELTANEQALLDRVLRV